MHRVRKDLTGRGPGCHKPTGPGLEPQHGSSLPPARAICAALGRDALLQLDPTPPQVTASTPSPPSSAVSLQPSASMSCPAHTACKAQQQAQTRGQDVTKFTLFQTKSVAKPRDPSARASRPRSALHRPPPPGTPPPTGCPARCPGLGEHQALAPHPKAGCSAPPRDGKGGRAAPGEPRGSRSGAGGAPPCPPPPDPARPSPAGRSPREQPEPDGCAPLLAPLPVPLPPCGTGGGSSPPGVPGAGRGRARSQPPPGWEGSGPRTPAPSTRPRPPQRAPGPLAPQDEARGRALRTPRAGPRCSPLREGIATSSPGCRQPTPPFSTRAVTL